MKKRQTKIVPNLWKGDMADEVQENAVVMTQITNEVNQMTQITDQVNQMTFDYTNKVFLAPMVRVGALPFRLLCRTYGADICFSEEIIDRSIMECTRIQNERLGTIDFVKGNRIVYQTCPEDLPNIFQMGTASSVYALKAAEIVSSNVAGIDINMGCPKHFSISGGMGAALLSKPDIVKDILSTLVRNINLPISCKIRLLPELSATVDLVKIIEQAGARAITIHGRRQEERSRQPVRWDEVRLVTFFSLIFWLIFLKVKEIVQSGLSIPIIHNGDILSYNGSLCFEFLF
jgi:tRNA-dihydrouridine synthase 2